jgi:transposase
MSFLNKLELPAPAGFLLTQQLALLGELAQRIHEAEKALDAMMEASPVLNHVRSLPGMGPILAAVVVSGIDNISRFPSAQKLCGYAVSLDEQQRRQDLPWQIATPWLRWAFVEAAWVAVGCSPYFGDFYRRKRALGKKANSAILATARLMARITWQLLTQLRTDDSERLRFRGGSST